VRSVAAEDKIFWGVQTEKGTNFHTGFLANQKSNVIFSVANILWGGRGEAGPPKIFCGGYEVLLVHTSNADANANAKNEKKFIFLYLPLRFHFAFVT